MDLDEFETHYQQLGVDESATDAEIKQAWRGWVKEFHSDGLNLDPSRKALRKIAHENLQRVNEAYEQLKDPDKRRQYDQLLREWRDRNRRPSTHSAQTSSPPPTPQPPPSSNSVPRPPPPSPPPSAPSSQPVSTSDEVWRILGWVVRATISTVVWLLRGGVHLAGAASRLIQTLWRTRRQEVMVTLGLVAAMGLVTAHYVLLGNTSLTVHLVLTGGVESAHDSITISWDGRRVSTIDKPTPGEIALQLPVRDIGRGELVFSSTSFDQVSRSLKMFYGNNDGGTVTLTRSRGQLAISSDLPDAEISFRREGKLEPSQLGTQEGSYSLPTGQYDIVVQRGLASASTTAIVGAGQSSQIFVPVPRGVLELNCFPAGSTYVLWSNNTKVSGGPLPATLKDVSVGDYRIEYRFREIALEKDIKVRSGETVTIAEVLPLGNLKLRVAGQNPRLEYKINRNGVLESKGSTPALIENLRSGRIGVTATDGTFSIVQEAIIEPARTTEATLEFDYGTAVIESTPSGAAFLLSRSGQRLFTGTTPFRSEAVLAGDYKVLLTLKGIDVEKPLTVPLRDIAQVKVDFPLGEVRVAGLASAEHTLKQDNGTSIKLRPNETTVILAGDYQMETRYDGIVVHRNVTVTTGRLVNIDPFADTGTVSLISNLEGTRVTVRPESGPDFSLSGIAPLELNALPLGTYTVFWEAAGVAETTKIDLSAKSLVVRHALNKSVHSVSDPNFWGIKRFEIVSSRFDEDFDRVWHAVYEQLRAVPGKDEEPYRIDRAGGYMIGKRGGAILKLLFNMSDTSSWSDHVVMVTDMFDGVKVQVVTELWFLKTTPDNALRPTSFTQKWSLNLDQEKSKGLSREFLNKVKKRLSSGK